MLSVTLALLFGIFLMTILKVTKRVWFFHKKMVLVASMAISILFLVALPQFLVEPPDAHHTPEYGSVINTAARYFQLLGVALGAEAAVVLSQVFLLVSRMPPDEKPKPLAKKFYLTVMKNNSPRRLKKNKISTEKASKEITKIIGKVVKKG